MGYDIYLGNATVKAVNLRDSEDGWWEFVEGVRGGRRGDADALARLLLGLEEGDTPHGVVEDWLEERGMPRAGWGPYLSVTVRAATRPDAPAFDNDPMTGRGNHRHPSYAGWRGFCEEAGLDALFFDEEAGLMRRHPGTSPLLPEHGAVIRRALELWRETHPDVRPGFLSGQDHVLARLLWLDWWVQWALAQPVPAIHNH
jgi:hypothetical protein